MKLSPRRIFILINPKSGPGKAYQVFKERVVPLLAESDVNYDLLITGIYFVKFMLGREYLCVCNQILIRYSFFFFN